ncbi:MULTISPECIES: hypothetical protein [Nocardia]|uniref:hypothetical protein n=1 Tax=Nocardia TaxID=1817 RepID=UPI0007A5590F|nr:MULTISPECIES: hypothetical protein [Nocardia]
MPLATADEVARGWRTFSDDERADANLLISAAEAWIRDPSRRPDIADGDPIAKRVVIEVVRVAMAPGEWVGYSAFSEGMGPFPLSGTLVTGAGTLQFLASHERMLGISSEPMPGGSFGDPPGYRYPPAGSVFP